MKLQSLHAVYKDGGLVFPTSDLTPKDGTEVVVTFMDEPRERERTEEDPIQALRGRGKGERLVEKLLQSRREDRERDERSHR